VTIELESTARPITVKLNTKMHGNSVMVRWLDDGDLDVQLDTIMMSRPIFRGISPSLPELNPLLATRIRQSVDLYKQTLYPIMNNGLVYHHTPLLPMMEPSPWIVLE
jgi:hypothetical protein